MTTSGIGRRRAAAQNDRANPAYLERRREIIDAAARVFKRKGYKGTRLGDIADELQTDRANLYYYVSSKDELFEEAVTEAVTLNITRAEEIRASEGTPREKLQAIIEELMLSYAEHYPFLRLADLIEGVAGEFSPFEQLHGFSIDGVDLETSVLPVG